MVSLFVLTSAAQCGIMNFIEHLFGCLHNGADCGWIPLLALRRSGTRLRVVPPFGRKDLWVFVPLWASARRLLRLATGYPLGA